MKTTSINHFEILKILLEEEHSKRQSDLIIEFIGDDAQKLDALAKHFLGNEYKLAQRAAMPFGNIARTNSKCIEPYLKDAILKINSSNVHDAIIRNVTRILAEIEIPEDDTIFKKVRFEGVYDVEESKFGIYFGDDQ